MTSEIKMCANCRAEFTIEPDDFTFYEKIQVPPPTWCPQCRLIRRLSFRNEHNLYKRKCDLCNQDKIFMYPADSEFAVYCHDCWWSDKWDVKQYAREYDFSKSFFEQFAELLKAVPRPGTIKQGLSVNSEYANRVTDQRNSYFVFGSIGNENCRYGTWLNYSKECWDVYNVQKSERCYECIDCSQCYNLNFSQECNECSDSTLLYNCRNCQNCFGCVNLRNKQYCIFNVQYSKEEYKQKLTALKTGSAQAFLDLQKQFKELRKKYPVPSIVGHHNTNVSGNWIENCKNVLRSFSCTNVEDGKYCVSVLQAKDVMDFTFWGANSEKVYEAISNGIGCANVRFTNECWSELFDAEYSMNCHSSKSLFGCVGMRNSEHCILNKQYSPEEYGVIVEKIKKQMTDMPYRDTVGRIYSYGEFFPTEISAHAYNESIAQEYFPIVREEAIRQGYRWQEPQERNYAVTVEASQFPDDIKDVLPSVSKEIVGCLHQGKCQHQCSTAFRILPEDLEVYKRANVPLPRLCPNCRHFERLEQRNPLQLWSRKCECLSAKALATADAYKNTVIHSHGDKHCPNEFETSFAPDRSEIVYCEECYQSEII